MGVVLAFPGRGKDEKKLTLSRPLAVEEVETSKPGLLRHRSANGERARRPSHPQALK